MAVGEGVLAAIAVAVGAVASHDPGNLPRARSTQQAALPSMCPSLAPPCALIPSVFSSRSLFPLYSFSIHAPRDPDASPTRLDSCPKSVHPHTLLL